MSDIEYTSLRAAVRGSVLIPGDPEFAEAAQPWNRAVEQDVLAVVQAADADDVAALVRFAGAAGVAVAAQTTGHSPTAALSGTILLRTDLLTELSVDPERRTARFGAGVRAGELVAAAAEHGLVPTPGSSPFVGATGYTVGGGVGWFARTHGIGAEHVVAFDVVDARGRRLRVSAEEHADLFWALRGGGGDFAVVVATELALHPGGELFGGGLTWPQDRAADVLAAFVEITADAPEELAVWVTVRAVPGGGPGVVVAAAVFQGPEEEGRRLLKPFTGLGGTIADTLAPFPITELGAVTNDPTLPGPSNGRAELVSRFGADQAAALLAAPIDPLILVQVRHLGGALARPGHHGPHGAIEEPFLVALFGLPFDAEKNTAIEAKQQALVDALGTAVTGRKPLTFFGFGDTAADAFRPADLARLQEVKAAWDPAGTIRGNYPVAAA